MEVVGQCGNDELDRSVRRLAANVVILQDSPGNEDGGLSRLAGLCLDVKVVLIRDDGRRASVHDCRRVHLADPSPATLVDAIRRALEAA
jgi:hypothetical protein